MSKPISFEGQVAVVTGAGRGLGRSHALELARRGAKVVVNDVGRSLVGSGESREEAVAVVDEIVASGGEAVADFHDLGDPEGAKAVIDTAVATYGTVDVLVNNAGHGYLALMGDVEVAPTRKLLDVHVLGSIFTTNAAWPIMREKGYGRIVLTTSGAGHGAVLHSIYTAAKNAIIGLALSLAEESRDLDLNVNVISPVASTRGGKVAIPSETLAPLFRTELVTAAVAYLCSRQCLENGTILSSQFGHYRQVAFFEGVGHQFDPRGEVTADDIAAHAAKIWSLEGALPATDPAGQVAFATGLAQAVGEDGPSVLGELMALAPQLDLHNPDTQARLLNELQRL